METLEIRKLEYVADKAITLVSYFRMEDGKELSDGTWELPGEVTAEQALEHAKTAVDEGIEVILNLTGQASTAGDSNSEEAKVAEEARIAEEAKAKEEAEAKEKADAEAAEAEAKAKAEAEEQARLDAEAAPADQGTGATPVNAVEVHDAEGNLVKTFTVENGEDFVEQAKKFAVDGGYSIGYK